MWLWISIVVVWLINIILLAVFVRLFRISLAYHPRFRIFTRKPVKVLTLRDAILKERWQMILAKASAESPDAKKVAVIEADKLVDEVLRRLGVSGEHMADRIAQLSEDDFPGLKKLWNAHRLRNKIAHETRFEIDPTDVRNAIEGFELFLKRVDLI